MTEFVALSAAASGMEAQRATLDVDARNVAAAETGTDFARLVPRFVVAPQSNGDESSRESAIEREMAGVDVGARDATDNGNQEFIRFAGTTTERGTGVDAVTEMVAVLNAQRAFEADASVFEAGKRLAERTIDVGRA